MLVLSPSMSRAVGFLCTYLADFWAGSVVYGLVSSNCLLNVLEQMHSEPAIAFKIDPFQVLKLLLDASVKCVSLVLSGNKYNDDISHGSSSLWISAKKLLLEGGFQPKNTHTADRVCDCRLEVLLKKLLNSDLHLIGMSIFLNMQTSMQVLFSVCMFLFSICKFILCSYSCAAIYPP